MWPLVHSAPTLLSDSAFPEEADRQTVGRSTAHAECYGEKWSSMIDLSTHPPTRSSFLSVNLSVSLSVPHPDPPSSPSILPFPPYLHEIVLKLFQVTFCVQIEDAEVVLEDLLNIGVQFQQVSKQLHNLRERKEEEEEGRKGKKMLNQRPVNQEKPRKATFRSNWSSPSGTLRCSITPVSI